MIAAMRESGKLLAINWPLAWYPAHVTAKRLCDEGAIGEVIEVHFYDGNRGPLFHTADKVELTPEEREREKPLTWFYKKEAGGGSLLDYLGYGATLGSWYHGGKAPIEVTSVVDEPAGLEVDEHSITVARYDRGLSKFETRWGTHSDPWTHQPLPRCGFVIVGTEGSIASYDFQPAVQLHTRAEPAGRDIPVDTCNPPRQNPVQYVIHCLETGEPIQGPLSPEISPHWPADRRLGRCSARCTSTRSASCRDGARACLWKLMTPTVSPPAAAAREVPAPALPVCACGPACDTARRSGWWGAAASACSTCARTARPATRWRPSATAPSPRPAPCGRSTTRGPPCSRDYREVFARDDIEVVDLAAHPEQRAGMFEGAIDAGKHILSQKPFVTDLDFGMRIVEKAERKGVRLAVNQNGRWAPHWSWIRQAIAAGASERWRARAWRSTGTTTGLPGAFSRTSVFSSSTISESTGSTSSAAS